MQKKKIARFIADCKTGGSPYLSMEDLSDMLEYLIENSSEGSDQDDLNTSSEWYKLMRDYALSVYPADAEIDAKLCRLAITFSDLETLDALLTLHQYDDDDEFKVVKAEFLLKVDKISELNAYVAALEEEGSADMELLYERVGMYSVVLDKMRFAYKWLKKGTALFPKNELLADEYAGVLQYIGAVDEAIEVFDRLLSLNPFDAIYWLSIGKLYAVKGDYELAIEAFDFALSCNSDHELDTELLVLKMFCLFLNNSYQQTIEVAKELVEKESYDSDFANSFLTSCYIEMQDYESAYSILKQLDFLNLNKIESVSHWMNYILVCIETQRYEEAREKLESLEELVQKMIVESGEPSFFSGETLSDTDPVKYLTIMNQLISYNSGESTFAEVFEKIPQLYPDKEEQGRISEILERSSVLYAKMGNEGITDSLRSLDESSSEDFKTYDLDLSVAQLALTEELISNKCNWN